MNQNVKAIAILFNPRLRANEHKFRNICTSICNSYFITQDLCLEKSFGDIYKPVSIYQL